jgi:L-amino acid N-acyltransferase YncA
MTMLARIDPARLVEPPIEFILDHAAAGHLEAMARIYREQVEDGLGSFEDPIPDQVEMARRLAAVRAEGLPAHVAVDGQGEVLGFCWARPFRPLAAYRGTVEDSIHVARAARRRGVGQALLTAVIEACTSLGYRQMIAVVGDARNLASIRLHQGLGFSLVGMLPGAGAKLDGPVDVVLLQRVLHQAGLAGAHLRC